MVYIYFCCIIVKILNLNDYIQVMQKLTYFLFKLECRRQMH
jgi:hypothetical protein